MSVGTDYPRLIGLKRKCSRTFPATQRPKKKNLYCSPPRERRCATHRPTAPTFRRALYSLKPSNLRIHHEPESTSLTDGLGGLTVEDGFDHPTRPEE
ncbi:hypothetical protein DY000_02063020 [Brassica cretica]|uniref:Uncharacterized protein n=1 Tax=Brassica cretica TaxID=69181 RepID=A0ABQ7AUS2_BRACR|nr:hypothetical protein DY000_02063020 [Brassica cretica]